MTSASDLLRWLREEEEGTDNQLWNLSQEIWSNPEIKYQEHRAHKLLTDFLERKGFTVQRSYLLPTAFRAEFQVSDSNAEGPAVAILCEYDALPVIGHSCGHNLIAELGVGAALALKNVFEHHKKGIPGKIVVLGTPAEEDGGGKIQMIDKGAFTDIDVALMAHPTIGYNTSSTPSANTSLTVDVSYKGRASHAAGKPWEGLNALDAAVACYVNVALLKQHIPPEWRANGIITKGGEAANIIPRESALNFKLRTPYSRDSSKLLDRFKKCVDAAAEATGCQASCVPHKDTYYRELIQNEGMRERFQVHCEELGFKFVGGTRTFASTDFGNVSNVLPGLHPAFSLDTTFNPHMAEFGVVAGKREAQEPTLKMAAALAATAADLFMDSELLSKVKQMHRDDIAQLNLKKNTHT